MTGKFKDSNGRNAFGVKPSVTGRLVVLQTRYRNSDENLSFHTHVTPEVAREIAKELIAIADIAENIKKEEW